MIRAEEMVEMCRACFSSMEYVAQIPLVGGWVTTQPTATNLSMVRAQAPGSLDPVGRPHQPIACFSSALWNTHRRCLAQQTLRTPLKPRTAAHQFETALLDPANMHGQCRPYLHLTLHNAYQVMLMHPIWPKSVHMHCCTH